MSQISYLRASGTAIPVSVWFISRRTQMTLVTAHKVELSMWQYSVEAFIFFVCPYRTLVNYQSAMKRIQIEGSIGLTSTS